jgi:hypothetical protein
MQNMLKKTVAAGLCALTLAGAQIQPAQAGNRGAGLAIGLATGLILGGIVLNSRRAHAHDYNNYNNYNNYNPDVNYVYDNDYQDCHRERYLVWQCYRDNRGRKHCDQVERLGRNVCN